MKELSKQKNLFLKSIFIFAIVIFIMLFANPKSLAFDGIANLKNLIERMRTNKRKCYK